MEILVCITPGKFEYKSADRPIPNTGESLIKIRRVGVCGTDLHAFEGTQPFFEYPRILGHEIAADYVVGDADGFLPGEPVTIIPYFACGVCIACRSNKPNCCVQLKVCGVHQDGAMVEYLVVPSYSLMHSKGLSYEQLALIEPLAIGAHSIRRAQLQKDEHILVMGAGPIGLGIMAIAKISGAKVIAMDVNSDRLKFCQEYLGIDHVINPNNDADTKLKEITNNGMPAVVIDATGNLAAINNGFEYLAHGGRYILVGLQKKEISFSHPSFHKKEATLMSSRNATREDFDFVINALKSKQINADDFITHRVRFQDVKNELPGFLNPASKVIKAMIEFQ